MALNNTHSKKVKPSLVLNSPTAQTIALIGDRWALLIIRDVFQGITQFESLLKRSGAARGTLTSRLKSLVQNNILYKHPYHSSPVRYEYRLTEKGRALGDVVLAAWSWEAIWAKDPEVPTSILHTLCGKVMQPRLRCAHCNEAITWRDITFEEGQHDGPLCNPNPPRSQRRSKNPDISGEGIDKQYFRILDILGDRWTGLVVAAALLGMRRYDDIMSAIGISTNILSDRLKLLVDVEVFEKKSYQQKPVRHDYHLTQKGLDLFPVAIAMHQWAYQWVIPEGSEPLTLTHKGCGHKLDAKFTCDQCDNIIKWGEVSAAPSETSEYKPGPKNNTESKPDSNTEPNSKPESEQQIGYSDTLTVIEEN